MKHNLILLGTIFLISCNGASLKTQTIIDENWQIAQIITQEHSYNKSGLLDTTRRIQNVYVNGEKGFAMNFIVTREYDSRSNQISERTFQVFKKKNELSGEVLFKYDTKNNLILVVNSGHVDPCSGMLTHLLLR